MRLDKVIDLHIFVYIQLAVLKGIGPWDSVVTIVLMGDGNLEIIAHMLSDLCYLISIKHLFISRTVLKSEFFKYLLITRVERVLSYHLM